MAFNKQAESKKPNFLVIVADDLGWSDVSPFGSEIHTPNIERLAKEGVRLTNFHTASACSPTRSMLLSGTDNHIAGLGQMAETVRRFSKVWGGKPGYEGYLNDRVAALPEILQEAGYYTTMSGKWHLGLTPDRYPSKRGFKESFALLPGGGNHFAYEPGTRENPAVPFLPPLYTHNHDPVDHKSLKNFYSSNYFAEKLIDQLKNREKSQSFFAYLPFTAPHWPLQSPKEYINKYRGRYSEGPDVLRKNRLQAQKDLGLIPENVIPAPVDGMGTKSWDELTTEEKEFSARTMEVYAAMVELLDLNIGRVIDYLKTIGELDNTFVIFMSDNGAEGSVLEAIPVLSTKPPVKYFDNSLENLGNYNSFIWYGPRWAQAATAPSRLSKGFITEGGIRCPAIIRYPPLIKPDIISDEFVTVMDILPTILELAEVPHPGHKFQGRDVVIPRGKPWIDHFVHGKPVHKDTDFSGWELFGQRAIRKGNYKAIYVPKEGTKTEWELYDLSQDKGELENLAKVHPDILNELIEYWLVYEAETGVVTAPDDFVAENVGLFKPAKHNL